MAISVTHSEKEIANYTGTYARPNSSTPIMHVVSPETTIPQGSSLANMYLRTRRTSGVSGTFNVRIEGITNGSIKWTRVYTPAPQVTWTLWRFDLSDTESVEAVRVRLEAGGINLQIEFRDIWFADANGQTISGQDLENYYLWTVYTPSNRGFDKIQADTQDRLITTTNLLSYTVQENATPMSLASSNGGFGQLSYVRPLRDEDENLIDTSTSLSDDKWGDFEGIIRDISDTDGILSVTADSALANLNMWYTIPPYSGSLSGYLSMLSNVTGVIIDTDTSRDDIVAPGYLGNVWEGFKEFLIVNKLEVAQVGGRIVVRELREFDSFYNHNTTESWNLNSQSTAEKVRVYWRDIQRQGNNVEVYAPEQHFVVDAGATVVQEVTIPGSITRVNQPQVLDYVPANTDYTGSVGAYCVSGKDGKPILAERWIAGGGSLRVKTTDDPSVIQIIITGSHAEEYAPYQIAATAGTSNYYNSLHITGDGMYWEKKDILVHTGAPRSADSAETPVEIDSINITSLDKAYSVALAVGKDYVGGIKTVTGTSVSLNRPEDRPNKRVPLFDDFNEKHGVMTFAQFNSEYAGMSFGDFNKFWNDTIAQSIENQAFGQVIGARARRGEAMYRIDALTTTPNNMQYTLKMDTTFEDFNQEYGTMTFGEFNALFAGYRFRDFNNRSLQGGK